MIKVLESTWYLSKKLPRILCNLERSVPQQGNAPFLKIIPLISHLIHAHPLVLTYYRLFDVSTKPRSHYTIETESDRVIYYFYITLPHPKFKLG